MFLGHFKQGPEDSCSFKHRAYYCWFPETRGGMAEAVYTVKWSPVFFPGLNVQGNLNGY